VSITSERTAELVEKFGNGENNSGHSAVQIAILSERIRNLTEHLKVNHKDFATRRGLLMLIGRRKRMQTYYRRRQPEAYSQLISELNLRR
jgi:small subunit ribosomal protein S15